MSKVIECRPWCRHECPECTVGLGTHLNCDPHCEHHDPRAIYQPEAETPFHFPHRNAMSVLDGPYATVRRKGPRSGWEAVILTRDGNTRVSAPTWEEVMMVVGSILRAVCAHDDAMMRDVYESRSNRRLAQAGSVL